MHFPYVFTFFTIFTCVYVTATNNCRKWGALQATGKESPAFAPLNDIYHLNSTLLANQFSTIKNVFEKIIEYAAVRIKRPWSPDWLDVNGKQVKSLPLSILKGRKPEILEEVADPLKIRLTCFDKEGVLASPTENFEFDELKTLLNHLKMDETFVDQYINETSHISLLSHPSQIAMKLKKPSSWTEYIGKLLVYKNSGVYGKVSPSSTATKFLCFTLEDVGNRNNIANFNLKSQLKNMSSLLRRIINLLNQSVRIFPSEGVYAPQGPKRTINFFFPEVNSILNFAKSHNLDVEEIVEQIIPESANHIKKLCEMAKTFLSRNYMRKGMFQLGIMPSMFPTSPGTLYNTAGTMSVSKVSNMGGNAAVVTLPLTAPMKHYKILPFLKNNRIFNFKYLFDSPLGRFVSRAPIPANCSGPLDNSCIVQKNVECAKAFIHNWEKNECTHVPTNLISSNLVRCSESEPVSLVITSTTPVSGTLDCHGDFDMPLSLPAGTTWLKPCKFTTVNGDVLNSIAGPVSGTINSPFIIRNPSAPVKENAFFVVYVVGLYIVGTLFLCIIFIGTTCWCYRRWRLPRPTRRNEGAPEAGVPLNVIYANAYQGAPILAPPSSGFIELAE